MRSWIDGRVDEVRSLTTRADDGSLWLMLFDDPHGDPILATTFDDAMADLDDVMLRNLAWILGELPAKAVLILIPRGDGLPTHADRQLWPELNRRAHGTIELLDVVVVGRSGHWSARAVA